MTDSDSHAILSRIATEATAAMTASVADGIAAKTSAAMSDVYSVALEALAQVKIQIENLEHALELKRKRSLDEVTAFVGASAQAMDFAATMGRLIQRIETAAPIQSATPLGPIHPDVGAGLRQELGPKRAP